MEERNVRMIMLEQYIRRLYSVSRMMNLYFRSGGLGRKTNLKRLKSEFQMLKCIAESIEYELDSM